MDKAPKLPNGETQLDYKLVEFAEGDPENPKNWSKAFKWYITMVVAITCFVVAFCSSVITSDVGGVEDEFGISHEAALVPISVFVVGFGVGESARDSWLRAELTSHSRSHDFRSPL